MCNPLYIANNVIHRSKESGYPLTHMKLQKILYFIYRAYIQKSKENMPLFSERFAVWKYGPVLESVYNAFKQYGSDNITDYYIENGKAYGANEEKNQLLHEVLDNVWEKCKGLTGIQLSNITHKKDSAWYNAYQNDLFFLDDEDIKEDRVPLDICN